MLISYSENFVFIHTPKTAGTSIDNALQEYAQAQDKSRLNKVRSALHLHKDYKKYFIRKHATISQIRSLLPADVFDSLFKFVFVRNPWDLLYSSYRYILQNKNHHRSNKVAKFKMFDDYLDYEIKRNKVSQSSFILDQKGERAVDFIGRFENLNMDFDTICKKLNLTATLGHVNQSKHEDYREVYTKRTREKVAQHWKQDIELLGYSFD
jgi:hypothetical protein